MRGSGQGGHFDARYEVDSMHEGMSDELYDPVGVVLEWWVFDAAVTLTDPVYDVGDPATGGRHWNGPYRVPVLGIRLAQGETNQNQRGLYMSDTMHAVINSGQIDKIFADFSSDPDAHLKDRFVYRGELWEPTKIWNRGAVSGFFTIIAMDATQVKDEQTVNDLQFNGMTAYTFGPYGSGPYGG